MSSVFDHLPAAVRALAPELDGWRGEPLADCANCSLTALDGVAPPEWAFSPEIRCCTAHPTLVNWLLGRALERGEPGRGRIVARLADREGVSPRGIEWPAAYAARYAATKDTAFGHDPELRCPYWVGGEHACGVWADRGSMCRAWYCRHDRGRDGGIAWHRADVMATAFEERLAAILIARGTPPAPDAALDAWLAWFTWCAGEVERLGPADLASLATPVLAEHRRELVQLRRARDELPELLSSEISEIAIVGDEVLVTGYSSFDAVRAPRTVFALIARLDGRTPWKKALAAARAELREPAWLDERLVRELYRVGAVR